MSVSFFDLMKYAATGIAAPDMTAYDKARALAAFGGGKTQTLTGVPPLSFKSNGKPLISLSMLGNGQQTGTPSPDATIMPEFCGVRTGNLYFKKIEGANISDSGVITALTGFDLYIAKVEQGARYSGNGYIYAFFEDEPAIGSISYNGSRVLDSFNNIVSPISGFVAARVSITAQNIMCNIGPSVLPYEPYGWAEKITCAGQTVPVYLGQVSTVRRIKKLVLTGEETWTKSSTYQGSFYARLIDNSGAGSAPNNYDAICSHAVKTPAVNAQAYVYGKFAFDGETNPYNLNLFIGEASWSATDFQSYLAAQYAAGTPVTIWYVLAEPQTAIVNEPLAKIGDYADELHSEDAGVTIPTVKGENTLTVESELQPSSMTIEYRA